MSNFKKGAKVKSENNLEYEIIKFLGSGAQGEVYEVKRENNKYALKIYSKKKATEEQKSIIKKLVLKGSPDDCFLWPLELVNLKDSFGYIMTLRPQNYKNFVELLSRSVEPTFSTLCKSGFYISRGFGILHAYGLCYKDIKHDNLFIDFESGKVLICDNDNVVPDKSDIGQIAGTIRFMAPEIVLCEEKPSTNTDLFSLAVLLFYLFNIHHPLEGRNEAEIKALDLPAMNYLYGKNPVFIWDPENDENRPVSFYQQNAIDFWNVYPDFFKEVFIRVFTKGLKNPKERITEKEWEYFCLKLLDSIILCANNKCQAENFYDFSKSNQSCWACGQVLPKPLCLEIDQDKLILNCNSFVLQHHIKGDFCIENEVGMVVKHPQTPNLWGIKNISKDIWTYTFPNGDTSTIPTGKAFPLKYGGKINFGKRNGTIV